MLQFLNNVIVGLLISFNLGGVWVAFHFLGILDGDYTDYTVKWYKTFGMGICLTLWI